MVEIKNVITASVHWCIRGVNATNDANNMLRGLPKDLSRLFAELRVGANNLLWIHPMGDWRPMSKACQDRDDIKKLVTDARRQIAGTPKVPKELIRIPNDEEYVFFRKGEDEKLQILFTGWGFENSKTYAGNGGVIDRSDKKTQNVRIGFTIEKELCPERHFTLSVSGYEAIERVTSAEGLFDVGTLSLDSSIIVKDINTGKPFSYVVTKGKTDYIGDITEVVTVRVILQRDSIPALTSEKVTMEYCGDSRTFESQSGQPVADKFVLREGAEMRVSAMGEEQSRILTCGENVFTFNVQTPPAKVRVCMNYSDGLPCVAETVKLMYGGKEYVGVTNSTGEVAFTMPYAQGQACKVTTSLGEETRVLKIPGEELFVFKEVKDPPLEASIRVRMHHADGTPFISESVHIAYNDCQYNISTNMEGEAVLTVQYAKGRLCTVSTSIGAEQRELSATREEVFLFTEMTIPPVFDYNIRFIDKNESPHSGVRVVFSQGERQWHATLDNDGCTVLPHGSFEMGKSIDVVMHHPSVRIYDIHFELEPDEYEYVIQTVPKDRSSWWILWLLLTIMLLALICLFAYAVTRHMCTEADPTVWRLIYDPDYHIF